MKLLLATTNQGKLAELVSLVRDLPVQVLSLKDVDAGDMDVVEDGLTFEENAVKKALAYQEKTGLITVADDSGLCVDALAGAPGVHSARYAENELGPFPDAHARTEANNAKLLRELATVPLEKRQAHFRCALCLAVPGQAPLVLHGDCHGRIAFAAQGDQGFGYDPLFHLPELGKTIAELSAEQKNQLSHRARAFQALRPHLEQLARKGTCK